MSIKAQATAINTALQGWMDEMGSGTGKAFVVSDMAHLWYQLFNGPKTLMALTMYSGEVLRPVFEGAAVLARVDRRFTTVFTRGRSFEIDRGSTLTASTFAGDPLFDLVEQGRDVIRGLQLDPISTERPIDFESVDHFPTMDTKLIIDAYQTTYTIGVQLNMLSSLPDNLAQGQ